MGEGGGDERKEEGEATKEMRQAGSDKNSPRSILRRWEGKGEAGGGGGGGLGERRGGGGEMFELGLMSETGKKAKKTKLSLEHKEVLSK